MKAIVLYQTDQWLSYGSRELLGVFTSKREYRKALKKIGASDLQVEMLISKGQSLCTGSDFEFIAESIDLNTITVEIIPQPNYV